MSEREQVWRERIEWQPWSGLTVAECCEEAGVSVASFYRWKKLLTEPQVPRRLRSTRRSPYTLGCDWILRLRTMDPRA